jgi:hypothetical protein
VLARLLVLRLLSSSSPCASSPPRTPLQIDIDKIRYRCIQLNYEGVAHLVQGRGGSRHDEWLWGSLKDYEYLLQALFCIWYVQSGSRYAQL